MDYWAVILAIVASALGIYYYRFKNDYFKKAGLPYIPPIPFLGNMVPVFFWQTSFAEFMQRIYNLHPEAKYVGFFEMSDPVIVIRDLELIKSICVKNFDHFPNHRGFVDGEQDPLFGKNLFSLHDEKWRDVRTLLSPAFTSRKMKEMFKLMSDCAARFADFMSNIPAEKREMEIKDAFTRYTSDVIATCAFGVTVDSMKNRNNEFYIMGKDASSMDGIRSLKLFLLRNFPALTKFFNAKFIPDRTGKFFTNLVADTIKIRDQQNIQRPDMIQLMMEARGKGDSRDLNITEMTSQALIFILGGLDTSAILMSFVAYVLAVNPDVQAKLQSEIDDVLEETNGEPTYEAINGMAYLDAVITETHRMYPPAVFLDRLCAKDFELPPTLPGAQPFTVKKGMNLWFPVYGIHRDPKYFENPDTFDPERFLGENKTNLNNGAYLPFGIGPRMCIGNRFALLEVKALLFHLLSRCDLQPCERTCIPMRLHRKGVTMIPENGFWLKVVPKDKPSKTVITNRTAAKGIAVH